jgi:hypothetical protein
MIRAFRRPIAAPFLLSRNLKNMRKWLVFFAIIFVGPFDGCRFAYATDVPLGGITEGITPFSLPNPIQFSTLNRSVGIVNGSEWIGHLALYTNASGTDVIATSSTIGLPGYGCNGDCGSLSFPSAISLAANTTYYAQFVKTEGFVDQSPSFVIGLHPSGMAMPEMTHLTTRTAFYTIRAILRVKYHQLRTAAVVKRARMVLPASPSTLQPATTSRPMPTSLSPARA